MLTITRLLLPFYFLLFFRLFAAPADWPMAQRDPQRTGYTSETVPPPYELLWRKDLGEPASGDQHAVVYKGKVFMPTHLGRLYALDNKNGSVLWKFQAQGPIVREPCCGDNLVITGSMDRHVYALDCAGGSVKWSFPAKEGIWGSPLITGGRVFFGDRSGRFYCLDSQTGKLLWYFDTGGPVLSSAASDNNYVFFASDDMCAYCLGCADGKLIWKTGLAGRTARDYWPVINGSHVVFTVMPALSGGLGWREYDEKKFLAVNAGPYRASVSESIGLDGAVKKITKTHEEFQALVEKYLAEYPERETFYMLDASTGKKSRIVPVLNYAGSGGPYPPPVVGQDGHYYLTYVKYYIGESQPLFAGRIDFEGQRAVIHEVCPGIIDSLPYGACDITAMLSMGGNIMYDRGYAGTKACDMKTNKMAVLPEWVLRTAKWPAGSNYFNSPFADSPGRTSSVAVSDGKVFYEHGPVIAVCRTAGGAQ